MTAPDAEQGDNLPTLTWESVTQHGSGTTAPPAGTDPVPERLTTESVGSGTTMASPPMTTGSPGDGSAGPDRLRLNLNLDLGRTEPPAAPPSQAMPGTTPGELVGEFRLTMTPLSVPDPAPPTHVARATPGLSVPPIAPPVPMAPVAPIEPIEPIIPVAPIAPVEPVAPIAPIEPVEPTVVEQEFELPPIRQATPVPSDVTTELPVSESEPVLTAVPSLPSVAAPVGPGTSSSPVSLPPTLQPDQGHARPAPMVSPLAVTVPHSAKPSKRRSRGGLRLVMALVVLAGVVAAAIVVGRPYLFPDNWEADVKPYAVEVEAVTGTAFAEAVTVTAEPATDYTERSTDQLTGDWEAQLPVWQALGLATGGVTDAGLGEILAGQAGALYSTADGQIYHDDSLAGAALDAELTRALSMALLDQQYGWSAEQTGRTLDDAALTSAHVLAQADATQRASQFAKPLVPAPTAPLAFLPAVLSYEVLAPTMYAALLEPLDPAGPNPLDEMGAGGPGPLGSVVPVLGSPAAVGANESIVGAPVAMDPSFWYLVLAGHLDAPTAYAASESIVESALTVVERSRTTCAYATFSGGGGEATATLRAALETWVTALPAEMAATFSVLGDGGLQTVSCDPGPDVPSTSRIGVARELVGWRTAEIATIIGVRELGGGDAEVAAALDRLARSDVGARLAASPLDDTPREAATAAKAAVQPIVGPPAPAEPAG